MSEPTLTKLRFSGGVWTGRLTGASGDAPVLDLLHEAERLAEPRVTPDGEGAWLVEVDIPADRLSEGVQTFVIATALDQATLATIPFVCGAPLADDIRAEVNLLRDELDMLKRAFRRHCVETASAPTADGEDG